VKNYLLDTNVVSELIKATPGPRVVAWFEAIDEDRIFISVATIAELRRGVQLLPDGKRRRQLHEWVVDEIPARFASRIVDVDQVIAEAWGEMSAAAQKSARSPSEIDALLAATAKVRDCVLVTRDVHDFEPFNIELFNPWAD
jgi:toxin FitB